MKSETRRLSVSLRLASWILFVGTPCVFALDGPRHFGSLLDFANSSSSNQATQTNQTLETPSDSCPSNVFNVMNYGAQPNNPSADNTGAFQSALNAAAATGGKVIVPVGSFAFKGVLSIPSNVTLTGVTPGPFDPYSTPSGTNPSTLPHGTAVLTIRSNSTTLSRSFISMSGTNATVQNLMFYYYDQVQPTQTAPIVYPPTIQITNTGAKVYGASFTNSYIGIMVNAGGASLSQLNVGAYLVGVQVQENATSTVYISHAIFHPYWDLWTGQPNYPMPIDNWVFNGGYAIVSNQAHDLELDDVACLSKYAGLRLGQTAGHATGLQFDSVKYGIISYSTPGFSVNNGYMDANGNGQSQNGIILLGTGWGAGPSLINVTGGSIGGPPYPFPNGNTLVTQGGGTLNVAGVFGVSNMGNPGPPVAPTWEATQPVPAPYVPPAGCAGTLSVVNYGAVPNNPHVDNTTAFQNALNAASGQGGGLVVVPPGNYSFNGTLMLPENAALSGTIPGPFNPVGLITPGNLLTWSSSAMLSINNTANPFISFATSSHNFNNTPTNNGSVSNFLFYYPGQVNPNQSGVNNSGPIAYPATININGLGTRVSGCSFTNSYIGVNITAVGRVWLNNLNVGSYWVGINQDGNPLDFMKFHDINLLPYFDTWTGTSFPSLIDQWVADNGYGITTEGAQSTNVTVQDKYCGMAINAYQGQPTTFGNSDLLTLNQVKYGVISFKTSVQNVGFGIGDSTISALPQSLGWGSAQQGVILLGTGWHEGPSAVQLTGGSISGFQENVYVPPGGGTLDVWDVGGVQNGIYQN